MTECLDNAKSYESQRALLSNMSLRDRRISMMQSRGLLEGDEEFMQKQDYVLKNLNGSSNTPLKQFLEEIYYRTK